MKKCQAIHEIAKIVEQPTQESLVLSPGVSAIDVETENESVNSTNRIKDKSDQESSETDGNDSQEEEEEDETATTPRLAKVDLRNMLKSKHIIQRRSREERDLQGSLESFDKDEQNIETVNNEAIEMKVIHEVDPRTEKKKSFVIFKEAAGITALGQKEHNLVINTRKESKVTTACTMISSHSIREKDKTQHQEEKETVQEKRIDRKRIEGEYFNKDYEVKPQGSKNMGEDETENKEVPTEKVVIDNIFKKLPESKSKTINLPVYPGDNLFNDTRKESKVTTACLIASSPSIRKHDQADQKGKEQMQPEEKDSIQKEDKDLVNIGEGIKTEYFNQEYEVRHQESEKLVVEPEKGQAQEVDTYNVPKYELKSETKSRTVNRLIYPEIFLFQKKRKNVTKNAPFKEVDVQTDEPSIQEYIPDKSEYCHLYTGKFEDGIRRVDLVLVMNATDNIVVENMKLNFFTGVVKAGIQIECEVGKLYKHKHLQFVKLYATDALLEGYSGVLGVHRYFRRYHEDLIYNRNLFMKKCCSTLYEKEILQSVRSRYVPPLKYSNLDRSYIVYMVLNKQTFGPHRNHCGLQILLDKKIILDAFMLHDGPYFCRMQQNYKIYNCRQALYLNWVGSKNLFKHQPFHLIHEYFGSKIAFYFVFYGFYNSALFFMAVWGSFMSIMYRARNYVFFDPMADDFCSYDLRKGPYHKDTITLLYYNSVACPDCMHQENTVCPFSLNYERCMDFRLLDLFECPYVFFYSTGMSIIGILFVVFWKHTECYWRWIWEEYLPCCDRQLSSCNSAICRFKDKVKGAILNIILPFISWILIIFVMFFLTHYVSVEWLRPLAVTYLKKGGVQFVPLLNRPADYGLIALLVAIAVIIFYLFEKLFHRISYATTKNECHRTFAQFERALILKKFFYSVLFGTVLLVYFAWLKGAFYMSPQEGWNTTIAFVMPWEVHEMNLTKINMYIRNVTFRALTLNCGSTSCLREAFVALCVILIIRYMIMTIVACIWRNKLLHKPKVPDLKLLKDMDKKKTKKEIKEEKKKEKEKEKQKKKKKKTPKIEKLPVPLPVQNPPQTTCEREYQLHKIKEREITKNFHSLFFQFLLVAYFSILFPALPWLVLIRNVFDLRKKAKLYLLYSRRPILFKTAGIGFWNFIMKLICYGIPIAHATTFLRMEIFKKYVFYKTRGIGMPEKTVTYQQWSRYLYEYNNNMKETKNKKFADMHYNKTSLMAIIADAGSLGSLALGRCRFDGFYASTKELENMAWSVQWNYLAENFTETAPMPDHYYLKFIKTAAFLVYMHLFAALAMMSWHYLGSCPGEVARYIHRERILCRFHNHRLNYFGKRYRFQPKEDTYTSVGSKDSRASIVSTT